MGAPTFDVRQRRKIAKRRHNVRTMSRVDKYANETWCTHCEAPRPFLHCCEASSETSSVDNKSYYDDCDSVWSDDLACSYGCQFVVKAEMNRLRDLVTLTAAENVTSMHPKEMFCLIRHVHTQLDFFVEKHSKKNCYI